MPHRAELIAVGTELLLGNIANTNAQELSRALAGIGIGVHWHTVVGDDPARLREAVDIARRRADVIVTTGGLGPTYDDLTKQTICAAFGRPLVFHPEILEEIRAMYERNLHTRMPDNNRQQAELPEGCTVFPNPVGTAPGCAFEEGGVHVLLLPGPPFEMRTMLEGHALPYLRGLSADAIVSHDIMTFGMGESAMEELLRAEMDMDHMTAPTLATYARPSEVRLRATARAESPEAAEALLSPVVGRVRDLLGDLVYGVDVPGLEHVCVRLLEERGWTLSTAESCTGGQLAARLTAIPGVSAAYRGGVVSYWTSVKRDVLGVPAETLERWGAVSDPTARAMAEGVRRIAGSEIGVSVTGVAGPDKDERGVDVGTVYVGLSAPDGTWVRALSLGPRRRDRIQDLAGEHAFDMVRRYLTGLPLSIGGASGASDA